MTYHWSVVSATAGSGCNTINTTSPRPTFTAGSAGNCTFELVVNDGQVNSVPDYVSITITAGAANAKPVADAGPDQNVKEGDFVVLDGTGSSDADGDTLTYHWSVVSATAGAGCYSIDTNSAKPTFTAASNGSCTFKLIVNDGQVDSVPDYVNVIINTKPVAIAVADTVQPSVGEKVELDGSGSSDADGDTLTFRWRIASKPSGSTAIIVDNSQMFARFTPDVPGKYFIQLVVNDGAEDSDPDEIIIQAQ